MPVARVQLPDGRIARFDVADGTSPQQVEAYALEMSGQAKADPTGSFWQNLAAGAGKAVSGMMRGMRQIDASTGVPQRADVAPTWKETEQRMAGRRFGIEEEEQEARRLDAPLMKTGGGVTGNIAGNIAVTVPAMMVPGAQGMAGAATVGGLLGALQPVVGEESRGVNTAIGVGAGAVGQKVGDVLAKSVSSGIASRAAAKSAGAQRDATLATSRGAGYVVPPTQANPRSAWNQLLEGFSGKIKTAQAASVKNQAVTNRLVRESIGLAEDAPITTDALKALRATAGQAYDDIAKAGAMQTDDVFRRSIEKAAGSQQALSKELPELARKDVLDMAASLKKDAFDSRTLVEATKSLRERASEAFRAGSSEVGRTYRAMSDAVEDLIERNMMQSGQGGALQAFREARQLIAKTHTIEAALNQATGNVVGGKLAAQLAKGKPLSGSLKEAASFAQAFPKAAQDVEKTGSALLNSPLDWATLGTASAITQNPLLMAGVAARPSVRSMILSRAYQSGMTRPNYGPGATGRVLDMLSRQPVRRALPGAAAAGSIAVNDAYADLR